MMNVRGFTLVETMVALMISAVIITLAWEGFASLTQTVDQLRETRTTVLGKQETLTRLAADVAIGVVNSPAANRSGFTITHGGSGRNISYHQGLPTESTKISIIRNATKRTDQRASASAQIKMMPMGTIANFRNGRLHIEAMVVPNGTPALLHFTGIKPAAFAWRESLTLLKTDGYAPSN